VALKPEGVYWLTIIDEVEAGKLWRASMATLRMSFKHVEFLASTEAPARSANSSPEEAVQAEREMRRIAGRQVYVIYASDAPLDERGLREKNARGGGPLSKPTFYTHVVSDAVLQPFLDQEPGVILTDQYAPVDNLMAEVFRRRNKQ